MMADPTYYSAFHHDLIITPSKYKRYKNVIFLIIWLELANIKTSIADFDVKGQGYIWIKYHIFSESITVKYVLYWKDQLYKFIRVKIVRNSITYRFLFEDKVLLNKNSIRLCCVTLSIVKRFYKTFQDYNVNWYVAVTLT